jgi:biotin carboxylase
MRKRLIFVESNTTGSGMRALRTAARLGLRAVLLTSCPRRYRGLAETGADIVDCDTNDFGKVVAALGASPVTIAGVTTTSEFYLVTAARLAESLGLPGNPPESVAICRDKRLTRETLRAANIGQPRFALVQAAAGVTAAVRDVGLPCVVKPVDESGSLNVRLCRTEAEAASHAAKILAVTANTREQRAAGRALIEEFVDAPEYSVEMFSVGGVATPIGVTAKTVGALPWFVEAGHLFPAPLLGDRGPALVACTAAALTAAGIKDGPTHTELRLGPAGPAVIEINARLAGGMIPELIRLTTGIDMLRQQILAATGQLPRLRPAGPAKKPFAGIRFLLPVRTGMLDRITGAESAARLPGVAEIAITATAGSPVTIARDAYGRLGHVIAHGSSPAEVTRRLDAAQRAITLTIVPEC